MKKHPINLTQQTGVAIIIVLLVVALATTLASYMVSQQSWWQRQLENQLDRAQARRIGIAAIDWARAILADDLRVNPLSDHPDEVWATKLPAVPVENGEVIGFIEDRQGRFNLNSVVKNGISNPTAILQFQRLLTLLGLEPGLAISLADWIDADSETQFPYGAEDVYYLSLPQPYRSANRNLSELNELILVKEFNESIIERLKPFVTTLPFPQPINANFAPPEVLSAVINNLSLADARVISQQRKSAPFNNIDEIKAVLPKNIQISEQDIDVKSMFFWVSGQATMGKTQVRTEALLRRNSSGWPTVIWQSVQ